MKIIYENLSLIGVILFCLLAFYMKDTDETKESIKTIYAYFIFMMAYVGVALTCENISKILLKG